VQRARFYAKGLGTTAKEAYDARTVNYIAEPVVVPPAEKGGDPVVQDPDTSLRIQRAAERPQFNALPESEQIARSIFAGVVMALLPFLTEAV